MATERPSRAFPSPLPTRVLRPARAQWCREDHHHLHAVRSVIPDQGEVTVDGFAGGTLEAKASWGMPPGPGPLPRPLGRREPDVFRTALWAGRQGAAGAHRRNPGARRAGGTGQGPHRDLFGRHEAAGQHGGRAVHRPKLLVLDEPTVGVDPQSRDSILETVAGSASRSSTRPITWKRRPGCATASASSMTAASLPRDGGVVDRYAWGKGQGAPVL